MNKTKGCLIANFATVPIYLPSVLKGACPAFEAWADKRSVGEKLPRGKYFKSREFIRQFKIQNYI
ncbi:hypothetical protein [Enterobacter hormaechei]|uniref:hypothetical protein n=1 Tax=Enterobacter hormaechei TaxID=158836 RepID=UPI0020928C05|nr:hypothetical protein [Enterobacter hormaechei]MCO5779450.1 hypothetical protein [Enterobacter hormaechei]MCR4226833.1 hypothetical protein [Enterobacter hormaechei]